MLDIPTFVFYIGSALLMGIAIGLERQYRQHPAGLRTGALVCVGSALFVALSRMMDHEDSPTRIAAQVVSGVGFLAGGVILREGFSVKGMNTAATLWCTAAVGTLAGAGFVVQGAIGTVAVMIKQELLLPFIGGVFVIEAISVILQVASYKLRKKRIFKMAPIHHHFELLGWSESKIIVRFWIASLVFALFALTTLKLR